MPVRMTSGYTIHAIPAIIGNKRDTVIGCLLSAAIDLIYMNLRGPRLGGLWEWGGAEPSRKPTFLAESHHF